MVGSRREKKEKRDCKQVGCDEQTERDQVGVYFEEGLDARTLTNVGKPFELQNTVQKIEKQVQYVHQVGLYLASLRLEFWSDLKEKSGGFLVTFLPKNRQFFFCKNKNDGKLFCFEKENFDIFFTLF